MTPVQKHINDKRLRWGLSIETLAKQSKCPVHIVKSLCGQKLNPIERLLSYFWVNFQMIKRGGDLPCVKLHFTDVSTRTEVF